MRKGIEPKRWKWLATHKREYHINDKNEIIDGTKVWTDTELESSILFEVPKENNSDNVDNATENANGVSQTLDTGNNNVAETTENANGSSHDTTVTGNRDGTNRSHEPLVINNPSSPNAMDANSNASQKKKVIFQGVPKYKPVNVNTIGLRRSPRIAELKKKQLDRSLNHVGFINVNKVSEEEGDPMKETYAFARVFSKEILRSLR